MVVGGAVGGDDERAAGEDAVTAGDRADAGGDGLEVGAPEQGGQHVAGVAGGVGGAATGAVDEEAFLDGHLATSSVGGSGGHQRAPMASTQNSRVSTVSAGSVRSPDEVSSTTRTSRS